MKSTGSLQALFVALVTGCGPTPETESSGSPSNDDDSGSSTATTATTSDTAATPTTATTNATTGETSTSPPVTDSVDDTFDSDDCSYGSEVYTVPFSEIEEWVDANGDILQCGAACQAAGLMEPFKFISCEVEHPDWPFPGLGEGSSGGESSGSTGMGTGETGDMTTGTGTSTTGDWSDVEVDLRCSWEDICGRGHAGLRSDGRNYASNPVGRWAAMAAHAEAASVPAFVHLRRELAAHGAPTDLQTKAQRAARDEVIHARMMSQLARRHAARVPTPVVERLPVRDLETLATENAVEGCVRETWAALEATYQAHHASTPELRTTMQRIATDETRHAQLAREIDAWCRHQLDDEAWARVDAARRRAVTDLRARVGEADPQMAQATGLPVGDSAREMFDQLRATLWA